MYYLLNGYFQFIVLPSPHELNIHLRKIDILVTQDSHSSTKMFIQVYGLSNSSIGTIIFIEYTGKQVSAILCIGF